LAAEVGVGDEDSGEEEEQESEASREVASRLRRRDWDAHQASLG
jgi:hypothetical protein